MTGREDELRDPGRPGSDEKVNDRETPDTQTGRLSPISRGDSRDFPDSSTDFRVDILDHDDEVIVVADLPGVEEDAIRINLLNPQTLRVTARRAGLIEEGRGYATQERGNGVLSRLIRLPASVTGEGARTRLKNGVLEMHLKKMRAGSGPGGKEVSIE
ncbi:Hsp20/alpha crystallin family protein [Methanoculleus sp.]|uniref:Hsp20/alpha crystallin family protein n=1 Tax=Methanoculleus sp. TaxID=90427 RepID=UPI002FC8D824